MVECVRSSGRGSRPRCPGLVIADVSRIEGFARVEQSEDAPHLRVGHDGQPGPRGVQQSRTRAEHIAPRGGRDRLQYWLAVSPVGLPSPSMTSTHRFKTRTSTMCSARYRTCGGGPFGTYEGLLCCGFAFHWRVRLVRARWRQPKVPRPRRSPPKRAGSAAPQSRPRPDSAEADA